MWSKEPLGLGCLNPGSSHLSYCSGEEGLEVTALNSSASRRHCGHKLRLSEKEVRLSGENLGAFPGHSWTGITAASPEPLDFLHALICTLPFLAREAAILRILVIRG